MILNNESMKPIYMQIAEWLEAEILNNHIKEDERIYSQYQLAEMFTINPATAAKGLNILAEEEIIYKKRGVGMFVSANARQFILNKRKNQVLRQLAEELVLEAQRLDVSESELIKLIQLVREKIGEEER